MTEAKGLEVRGLSVSYGKHRALENVSLRVARREIVVILGANGAGKSSLLRAISGTSEGQVRGEVLIGGEPVHGLAAHRIVERGIALVPEGRGVFADLTVRENLTLGAHSHRARGEERENLERVMALFPRLAERRSQVVRTMSGGEQQMVAIGRAMMSNPAVLMLDEPSLGLSPLLCKELFQNLARVREGGLGILLVEQNARQSLAISDRGYLLENGSIQHEDSAEALARDPAVQAAYLGAAAGSAAPVTRPSAHPAQPAPGTKATPAAPADIAAAALESVQHMPLRTRPRPVTVRPADELIGTSISDLVEHAARKQSRQLQSARSGTPAATGGVRTPGSSAAVGGSGSDRLRATLAEIERAAADARDRARVSLHPMPPLREASRDRDRSRAATTAATTASQSGPAPVVEVYRAPRVEVYRRRPDGSGSFERQ